MPRIQAANRALLPSITYPRRDRLREEFGPDVRSVVHGTYLILYTTRDDGQVVIDCVVHGARDLDQLLGE